MDIYVCVRRVPDTSEVEIEIDRSGRALEEDDFSWDINEWDAYAVEAAVQLKERLGARVTALTVGDEDDEEVLRRALAMGCDQARLLSDDVFAGADSWVTARILAAAMAEPRPDLVLCGAVSADQGRGQVGGFLAGLLDLPLVALATDLQVEEGSARVRHEVSGGVEHLVDLRLPAVVTVQTGLNEPRYVSIRGIRKVAGVEIPVLGAADLGLDPAELQPRVVTEELFPPPQGGGAEILTGSGEEQVERLVELLHEHGGLV
ncbi:MAG: electron transfer flavoprotein subunit beta/FixA family protein [Planctomycetota bacterium]|nr:MAG: electron transfer flavoprotein subunit beta/FixA family protein [Planctomycetota bacterium]